MAREASVQVPPGASCLVLAPATVQRQQMVLAALTLALMAAAKPTVAPRPPTEVATLTVHPPTPQPKVIASYPAQGAAVAPGVVVLKLTFDQPMLPTGFDVAAAPGVAMPKCLKTPRLLNDSRTFVLLCTLNAGASYAVSLNSASPGDDPNNGFANTAEHRAAPTVLTFTATRDEPIRGLEEAMRHEGLTALEGPVQEGPTPP